MTILEQATTNVMKELGNTTWTEQKYASRPKSERKDIQIEFAVEKLRAKEGLPTMYLIARDKNSGSYIYIAETDMGLEWVAKEDSQYYSQIKQFAELVVDLANPKVQGLSPNHQAKILVQIADQEFQNHYRP